MVRVRHKGDFAKLTYYLKSVKKPIKLSMLEKYGKAGVAALASATPKDTGLTASSWYYKVEYQDGIARIIFCNSNIQNGIPIAIILQYGHGTRNGGWVEGVDYINPALKPIFDKLADDAWREVTKV